jgi:streptogramin lyase
MNKKRNILASALAATMALTLAACGGGGGGSALPASPAAANTSSLNTAMSKITFSFSKSGATASTTASSRSPQYLPSTIQSVSVGVTLVNGSAPSPSIAPIITAVGPTAPGCATDPSNSGNYLCTLTYAFPIGVDTLSVKAYDGTSGTGNLVSQQQPAFTVVSAQANTLALTLDAVPGTITVGAAPSGVTCSGSPLACSAGAGSGPYTIPVTIADAHGTPLAGNTIPGSPVLSATSDTPADLIVTVTQNPYAIVVSTIASGSAHVTITATSANAGDGIATTTTAAVTFTVNAPAPSLNLPLGMAFDATGNLWVANYVSNTILEYASPYTGSPILTVSNTALIGPAGIVFDSSHNMIVSSYNNNTISVFTPPYTGTPVTFSARPAGGDPFQIALDASGNLYVATSSNALTVFAPPFTSSSTPAYSITTGITFGYGLAFDGSGNLWYMDGSNGIEEYTPPFSASSAPVLTMSNAAFKSNGNLAFDAAGNLYYTNSSTLAGVVAPPFTSGSTPTTFGTFSSAYGVASHGSDIFVSDFINNKIQEFTLPVSGSSSPIVTVTGLHRSDAAQALPRSHAAAP